MGAPSDEYRGGGAWGRPVPWGSVVGTTGKMSSYRGGACSGGAGAGRGTVEGRGLTGNANGRLGKAAVLDGVGRAVAVPPALPPSVPSRDFKQEARTMPLVSAVEEEPLKFYHRSMLKNNKKIAIEDYNSASKRKI